MTGFIRKHLPQVPDQAPLFLSVASLSVPPGPRTCPPLPARSPNLFRMGFEPDVLREAIRHSHGYDDRAVIELILKIQPLLDTGAEFGHAFTMLKQFDWDAESALLFMEGRRFL